MDAVTRVRRGAQTGNDHGSPVYGPPVENVLPGALFAPGGTTEPFEVGRAAVITVPTLYFVRTWPDLLPTDQVRVRDELYDVVGDPADWRSGFGSGLGGMVVELRKVDG